MSPVLYSGNELPSTREPMGGSGVNLAGYWGSIGPQDLGRIPRNSPQGVKIVKGVDQDRTQEGMGDIHYQVHHQAEQKNGDHGPSLLVPVSEGKGE